MRLKVIPATHTSHSSYPRTLWPYAIVIPVAAADDDSTATSAGAIDTDDNGDNVSPFSAIPRGDSIPDYGGNTTGPAGGTSDGDINTDDAIDTVAPSGDDYFSWFFLRQQERFKGMTKSGIKGR